MRQLLALWLFALAARSGVPSRWAPTGVEPTPSRSVLAPASPTRSLRTGSRMDGNARPGAEPPHAVRPEVEAEVELFSGVAALKEHLDALVHTVPDLPSQLAEVRAKLQADLQTTGWLRVLLLIATFVGLGILLERCFLVFTSSLARPTCRRARRSTKAARTARRGRLIYDLARLLLPSAALGRSWSLTWPTTLRSLALGYLLAFLTLRAGMVIARLLFAPGRADSPPGGHG